jgi:hypothetical protein
VLARPTVQVALGAALLLVPALVAGGPFVFYDADTYYEAGRWAYAQLSDSLGLAPVVEAVPGVAHSALAPLAGRSSAYGLFLYLTASLGGLWATSAVQAATAAWILHALARAFAPAAPRGAFAALIVTLTGGASLPFFAAFAMPDLFAGLGAAAAILLLLFPDRFRSAERLGLWGFTAAAMAAHQTHLAVGLVLAACGGVLLLAAGAGPGRASSRAAAVFAAAAVAASVNLLYAAFVHARTGEPLLRPPFVTARVLADGPGRDYLRAACAHGAGFELCRFRGQRLDSSDRFLWSARPGQGVFSVADAAERRRLAAEQVRFVAGVLIHAPLRQASASARNFLDQATSVSVDEPLTHRGDILASPEWRGSRLATLTRAVSRCAREAACPAPPLVPLKLLHGLVLALTGGWAAWRLSRRDVLEGARRGGVDSPAGRVLAAVVLVVLVLAANAAVCGVLSGTFPRYQARLIWLAPALAVLCGFALPLGARRADRPTLLNAWFLWTIRRFEQTRASALDRSRGPPL